MYRKDPSKCIFERARKLCVVRVKSKVGNLLEYRKGGRTVVKERTGGKRINRGESLNSNKSCLNITRSQNQDTQTNKKEKKKKKSQRRRL